MLCVIQSQVLVELKLQLNYVPLYVVPFIDVIGALRVHEMLVWGISGNRQCTPCGLISCLHRLHSEVRVSVESDVLTKGKSAVIRGPNICCSLI